MTEYRHEGIKKREYDINCVKIELDTSKTFLDFYWHDKKGQLSQLNLEKLLDSIQSGDIPIDEHLKKYMIYLKRWKVDAPRKRGLRKMRKEGFNVMTSDALFEEDGGEEIIDNLENTGIFAAYFLKKVYGEDD